KVVLSGISNGSCTDCTGLNSDYVLDRSSSSPAGECRWQLQISPVHCGYGLLAMNFVKNAAGGTDLTVTLTGNNPPFGSSQIVWRATDVKGCLSDSYTPTYESSTNPACSFNGSTAVVTPIKPNNQTLKNLADLDCFIALGNGCPDGSNLARIVPPYLGQLTDC